LKREGKYGAGLAQGDFIHYNENGFPVMTITYRDGVEVRIDGVRVPPPLQPGAAD
jgi:hypothetical protein